MMVGKFASSVAAVALALGMAASAQATIVTATYTGTVINGSDQTGVFGVPGANLAGDSFTAVFTVDTSIDAYSSNDPGVENFYGGSEYAPAHDGEVVHGDVSPVSATITINGRTVSVPGAYWGRVWDSSWAGGASELNFEAMDQGNSGNISYSDDLEGRIFSYVHSIDPTSDFTQPLAYTVRAGDTINNSVFKDSVYDNSTGTYLVNVSASLNPTSVIIDPPGATSAPPVDPPAVPEPSTWTMLVLGVGMIGFTIRRRNKGMAVAA